MYGVPHHFYSTFFLADFFLTHNDIDIANFADDNTLYFSAKNVQDVESLQYLCSDGLKSIF